MDTSCTKYKVRQCSRCPGDTEYSCISCPCSLCLHCKEMHVNDLKTIDHNVVIYSEKSNHPSTQELCVRHSGNFYRKCCESCELFYCSHTTHKQIFGQHMNRNDIKPEKQSIPSEVRLSITYRFS